jgi:hypothetical protein
MDTALLHELQASEQDSGRLFLDVIEFATRLERGYGHYFKPYTGSQLYLDLCSKPVLDFDKHKYHCFVDEDPLHPSDKKIEKPVRKLADIAADVFDKNERLVFRVRDVAKLREQPDYPARMIDFIFEYIEDFIHSRIPALDGEGRGFNLILETYLNDDFLAEYEVQKKTHPEEIKEFVNEIWFMLEPMMAQVREFMGPNKWMIYSAQKWPLGDLVIDRYCDYRIYIYHERLKQELQAKERGKEGEES